MTARPAFRAGRARVGGFGGKRCFEMANACFERIDPFRRGLHALPHRPCFQNCLEVF